MNTSARRFYFDTTEYFKSEIIENKQNCKVIIHVQAVTSISVLFIIIVFSVKNKISLNFYNLHFVLDIFTYFTLQNKIK